MRRVFLCAGALALMGCGQAATTSFVKSETTLGRVVIYRNGVAYFERYAEVTGDDLKLAVPSDKVDDFLKSLTVVDAKTGEPAPISYPSTPSGGGTIDMKVGAGHAGPRKLRVSYVTEAPSWKPSYRVVVGKSGKVELQGWAIVDNTSGEDWVNVKLGVGASSAMSFRFDLKGLRVVARETLQGSDLFVQAPPMGGSSYGQNGGPQNQRLVGEFSDDLLAHAEVPKPEPRGRKAGEAKSPVATAAKPPPPSAPLDSAIRAITGTSNPIVVEGFAGASDKDKQAASLDRANKLRDQLVRSGVDPNRVVAIGRGEQAGRSGGVRLVEAAQNAQVLDGKTVATKEDERAPSPVKENVSPIGTSHFESGTAMTVKRGTSAMVSIMKGETEGEVVYLYDPESPRGNASFPFRTLRFRNPTNGALESGPVTVFGDGRFVGEGLAEPIPAHAIAFVPFALDRQIVVERKDGQTDEIAKILTVQRGVFGAEVRHTKRATFTLYNRMAEKATVYLRHTVQPGYTLRKAPEMATATASDRADHIAGAHLFRVELEPNGKTDVVIEEATPVLRSTDIRSSEGMDLVRAYLSGPAIESGLRGQVEHLLKLHADMAKIEQQIGTHREQMGEYRLRMDELHAQIVTLRAVKTAGPLMSHLEKKLQEVSEQLSKATVEVVSLQEKAMVARIGFQNGVADLSLEPREKANREASK